MMKKIFVILACLSIFTLLTACEHTVSGFGKDMEQNGQKIQNETNK